MILTNYEVGELANGEDFNEFCEKVLGYFGVLTACKLSPDLMGGEVQYGSAETFRPISLALNKTRSAFHFVAWESRLAFSGSSWVYRTQ
jgi:hypothetical protein